MYLSKTDMKKVSDAVRELEGLRNEILDATGIDIFEDGTEYAIDKATAIIEGRDPRVKIKK